MKACPANWGSKVPYRRAAELLSEFLPLSDRSLSHSTLRRPTLAVGAHLDQRVTEPEEYDWPDSQRKPVAASARMTVSIDGTYVRADSSGCSRQHYVVAGRIERDGQLGDRFAWIAQRPTDPVDFMKATLENNGWTSASRVAVLADGADGLTNLVDAATSTPAVGVLDWFHISMRFRPIEQMIRKVALLFDAMSPALSAMIRVKLPRVRYQMWNGRWHAAATRVRHIYRESDEVDGIKTNADVERVRRFRQHLLGLLQYMVNNQANRISYAHAYRHGLRISSCPAESGMSHLVNQRLGKRQPMCWSAEGAHLLLQVRCAVLNDRLDTLFQEWHPQFRRQTAVIELPAL